jgi:hypothetical protein
MNHETASGMKAAERYVLGDLPPAERDDFEEHLSDCSRCMEDVWTGELFRANARAVFQDRASGRPIPKTNGWLDWFRLRPVPVLAFSGALNLAMLALVGYGLHAIPALESRVNELDRPEVSQVFRVRGLSRGAEQEFTVTRRFVASRIDLPRHYQRYAYILKDGSGSIRRSGPLTVPPDAQEMYLTLPVGGLDAGDYRLQVTGSDGGQADVIAAFLLHVQPNK